MAPFVEHRWRARDGLGLFARDYPAQGPARALPVICLHGLTRNSRDFEDVAPWIAGFGRRVLAVDVRGRGGSDRDPDPSNYQFPIYADDVFSLADGLGVDRAVFVGTSMGGLITVTVAAARPALVAAAVLNDIGPELAPEGLARILSYAGETPVIRDWNDAAAYMQKLNGAALPAYGADDWAAFARRTFRESDAGPVLDYDPAIAGPLRATPADPPPDLWPAFNRLTGERPALLLRGAISDLLSPDTARRMRDASPTLAYAEVPGVGHAPMLTEPAARAALTTFLNRVP